MTFLLIEGLRPPTSPHNLKTVTVYPGCVVKQGRVGIIGPELAAFGWLSQSPLGEHLVPFTSTHQTSQDGVETLLSMPHFDTILGQGSTDMRVALNKGLIPGIIAESVLQEYWGSNLALWKKDGHEISKTETPVYSMSRMEHADLQAMSHKTLAVVADLLGIQPDALSVLPLCVDQQELPSIDQITRFLDTFLLTDPADETLVVGNPDLSSKNIATATSPEYLGKWLMFDLELACQQTNKGYSPISAPLAEVMALMIKADPSKYTARNLQVNWTVKDGLKLHIQHDVTEATTTFARLGIDLIASTAKEFGLSEDLFRSQVYSYLCRSYLHEAVYTKLDSNDPKSIRTFLFSLSCAAQTMALANGTIKEPIIFPNNVIPYSPALPTP